MSKDAGGDLFTVKESPIKKEKKSVAVLTTAQHPVQIIPMPGSPSDLLVRAIEKGLDINQLERLIELKNKQDDRDARKAFFSALSDFQRYVPELKKTKKVSFPHRDGSGSTEYWYAPLSEICHQIKEPLHSVGLSYRWEIKEEANKVHVTCLITHLDGHCETTSATGLADDSGKKNAIQQKASTITYLQRYTLIGGLGLSSADMDNDGKGGKQDKKLPTPSLKQYEATMSKILKGEVNTDKAKEFYTLTDDQEKALRKAEEEFKSKRP